MATLHLSGESVPVFEAHAHKGNAALSLTWTVDGVKTGVTLLSAVEVDAWATAFADGWSQLSRAGLDAFGAVEVAS